MSKRSMYYVKVVWADAHADHEFQDEDTVIEHHTPAIVTSVGMEFLRDEHGITLIRDYDDDGDSDGRLFIPAGMIKSRKVLVEKP